MDDERLASLYRKFGPAIYSRCRRMLLDEGAAEDAAQETFLRVARHLDSAPTTDDALYWIYRIATNHCLNELRSRKNHASLDSELEVSADGASGEQRIIDRDLARRLVLRAPEHLRAAAWLHHVDGLKQGEVATVLGVSRRTVVSYLVAFKTYAKKFIARSAA